MRTALILVVALATVVNGDITGSNPHNGACLCISGRSVNIRSSACGQGIVGSASSHQCFKYTGSSTRCSLNSGNYHFFQINYNGNQGWAAGDYLNLESDSRCGSSGGSSAAYGNGNEYRCQVTDRGRRIHESSSHDCVDIGCLNTCRGGQCVAYVKCRCTKNGKYPPSTRDWRPGQSLKTVNGKCNRNIAPNTAIATFDSNGRYNAHAAVFIRCQDDYTVQVYDQWCARSVGFSTYNSVHRFYGDFATIISSSDGPGSTHCRSETSGPTDCKASYPRC